MKIKYIFIIEAILITGLIIWEIQPIQMTHIQLAYDNEIVPIIPENNCPEINELLKRKWDISFPVILPKGESGTITAILNEYPFPLPSEVDETNLCNFALEFRMELPVLSQTNGGKIISPYAVGSTQQIEWNIVGLGKTQKGTLWITLLSGKDIGQISRFPLFAVPIEIKGNSFFGIAPRTIRLLLILLIFIGLLITIRKNVIKANDII